MSTLNLRQLLVAMAVLAGTSCAPSAGDRPSAGATNQAPGSTTGEQPSSAAASDLTVDPPPAVPISAERLFSVLCGHTWTIGSRDRMPDYTVYRFQPDGKYVIERHTDYDILPRTGRWNLARDATGLWHVCLDDGHRHPVAVYDDGSISLTWMPLQPDEAQVIDPQFTAETLPVLKLPSHVLDVARQLSAHPWQLANDFDLSRQPTIVTFDRDWRYCATYQGRPRASCGSWSAAEDEILAVKLKVLGGLKPPDNSFGEQLRVELLEGDEILINGDLYRKDAAGSRGVSLGFNNWQHVRVRVEYDTPIRRGIKNRLEVTVSNLGKASRGAESLVVERFFLTRKYHDYRRGNSKDEPPVLAGPKQINRQLSAECSTTFSLDATFPQAGKQWIYFNVLLAGSRQAYDVQKAREINVVE